MFGNLVIPFTELLADTICCHGIQWAHDYYISHGMSEWEFNFWLKALEY